MLFLLTIFSIGSCLVTMYIYRQDMMGDRMFMLFSILLGGILVYTGLIMLGVPYSSWKPMSIFVFAGLLLGFQASRVAIRYRRIERANSQSRKDNSE